MIILPALSLLFTCVHAQNFTESFKHYDTPEVIKVFGYPSETHFLQTADNYTVRLNRIPHGKNDKSTGPKKPALILPGLYCSSYFFFFYQDQSLPLLLADNGYDVYVADFRGQMDKEASEKLPSSFGPKAWKFSMDDLADYDVPAYIDFIMKSTGQKKISIFGHSLGNTIAFMTLAWMPQYNDIVDVMVAAAPGVYVAPESGPAYFLVTTPTTRFILLTANDLTGRNKLQVSGSQVRLLGMFCRLGEFGRKFCQNFVFKLFGPDSNLPAKLVPVVADHVSAVSFMSYNQYLQHTESGRFARYDFGESENMKRYNSSKPPIYDLTKVKTAIVIYDGPTDQFNKELNNEFLRAKLPNLLEFSKVKSKEFDHFSVVANDMIGELMNQPTLKVFNKFRESSAETTQG